MKNEYLLKMDLRMLIELLSVHAPSPETKLKLLKEIAEEHQLDWDPAPAELNFFKRHEDLLNGPTQFVGWSKLPLPTEEHDETLNTDEGHTEQPDSDSDSELLDFPEVPRVSLQLRTNDASAPKNGSVIAAPFPETDHESLHYSEHENLTQDGHLKKTEEWTKEELGASKYEIPSAAIDALADKQFLPYISPPTLSSASFSAQQHISPPSLSSTKNEANVDLLDVLAAAQVAAEHAAAAARSATILAQVTNSELVSSQKKKRE
ncbi:hypothetical protein HS088_TW15G00911 [Tripterygium wilfordii]|uniref:Uncharacterized protein n=1 Tax=Tripterygium wilfordii TaxID=458696 RepID=A0A7J7CMZ9_TRIWF|nr:hypothetical protein HS088_TW15G00911 [Tripterygium wilfordii]